MDPSYLLRGIPVRANGGSWVLPGKRLLVPSVLAVLILSLLLPDWARSYVGGGEILLRNEALPLDNDLSIGRFGVGDLFFDRPADVDTDSDDHLYILDAGNRRIQVADEKGNFLFQWALPERRGPGEEEYAALVIDKERKVLYVLHRKRRSIQKYTLSGQRLLAFGKEGLGKGYFDDPVDLTVDIFGYIYVLDRARGVVLKFRDDGSLVGEFGSKGDARREFTDPVSIVFSRETIGFLYVLDRGRESLLRFDRDGVYQETIPLPPAIVGEGEFTRVRTNREDDLFVLDAKERKLIKLKKKVAGVFGLTSEKTLIEEPGGLAIDSKNRIYLTDMKKNRIIRFLSELP